MVTLEYLSDDALYTMVTTTADGCFYTETRASSTATLISKMLNYDSAENVNDSSGYFEHTFRRALVKA